MDGKELLYIEQQVEYVFNCGKKTPSLWLDKDLKDSDVICVACGDLIKESELKRNPCACNECDRMIHSRCQRRLKIQKASFNCSQIKRRIVPIKIGSSKLRDFENIKPKVASGHMRCLVCGELNTDSNIPRIRCERPGCLFSCHEICLKAHNHITNLKHGVSIRLDKWCCDDIKYWIDSSTVTKINNGLNADLLQAFMECYNIEPVKQHINPKKRRYDNDNEDMKCEYCHEIIPLEQDNHLWSYCTAFSGSPPSKDPMECVSRIKRRCRQISRVGSNDSSSGQIVTRDGINVSRSYRDALMSDPVIPEGTGVRSLNLNSSRLSVDSVTRYDIQDTHTEAQALTTARDPRSTIPRNESSSTYRTTSTTTIRQSQILTLTNRFTALATQSDGDPPINPISESNNSQSSQTTLQLSCNPVLHQTRRKKRNRSADNTELLRIDRGSGPRTRRKKGPLGPVHLLISRKILNQHLYDGHNEYENDYLAT